MRKLLLLSLPAALAGCQTYESPASPDWKPVIDYVWDLAGCKA